MNKVLPSILLIIFWGLFHIGITQPKASDTIAIVAIICFVLLTLYSIKHYLLNVVLKNK